MIEDIDAATDAAAKAVSARLPEIIREHMGRDMTFAEVIRAGNAAVPDPAAGRCRAAISVELYKETMARL
jgi:hypothetical protein